MVAHGDSTVPGAHNPDCTSSLNYLPFFVRVKKKKITSSVEANYYQSFKKEKKLNTFVDYGGHK